VLSEILSRFKDHVTGTTLLSEQVLKYDAQFFMSNFNSDWDGISAAATDFTDAYFDKYPAIFHRDVFVERYDPNDFPPEKMITFYLQKWMFDNLFVAQSIDSVAGMKFKDADVFLGVLADNAPRITKVIEFEGSYATNPGYFLNDQKTVLRPSGLYIAPSELVTLDFDEKAIGKGIIARVGLHRADLETTWTTFARFPRISNTFSINQKQVKVANPFGGGLYFEVPDGTSLGKVRVTVTGAVKMPMYSTLDLQGHSADLDEFTADLALYQVPWFEITSKKFTTTQPINARNQATNPQGVLNVFDEMFDAISLMTGRPLERIRSEWLTTDAQVTVMNTAMAASYPIFGNKALSPPQETWDNNNLSWFEPWPHADKDVFLQPTSVTKENNNATLV